MPYAILRFEKRRGGTSTAIEKHHEREKEAYKSNPDIDVSMTRHNYHIKKPDSRYYIEIQSRIEAAKCRVRRDSTKYVDTFIGGTHDFIAGLSPHEQREYFQRAYDFISERVDERNIFSAAVHMDERTPHLHLCFVPLTQDNRLSAKEILGNRQSMVKWQDDFYAYMSERWAELQRGQAASETNRKHIPVRLYKQAMRLDEKVQEITTALADINVFNMGKKRDQALVLLSSWLPDAENFTSQVKTVDSYIKSLETGGKTFEAMLKNDILDLKGQLSEKDESLFRYHQEVHRLQEALRTQKRLLELVPEDVLEQLKNDRRRGQAR